MDEEKEKPLATNRLRQQRDREQDTDQIRSADRLRQKRRRRNSTDEEKEKSLAMNVERGIG